MALVKCPRCELNYILDGEKLCTVCRREVRGEVEHDDMTELCSECGEHPAVPGSDLCIYCLKEQSRHAASTSGMGDDSLNVHENPLDLESVTSMDEIELDLGGDIDDEAFREDAKGEFDDDEEEDGEEDGDGK